MDHQLLTEVRTIDDYLNDRFAGLLSTTCTGCPFYRTSGFWDEGGPQVAGGMAPRWVTSHACDGTDFRLCQKMTEVLNQIHPVSIHLLRKAG